MTIKQVCCASLHRYCLVEAFLEDLGREHLQNCNSIARLRQRRLQDRLRLLYERLHPPTSKSVSASSGLPAQILCIAKARPALDWVIEFVQAHLTAASPGRRSWLLVESDCLMRHRSGYEDLTLRDRNSCDLHSCMGAAGSERGSMDLVYF